SAGGTRCSAPRTRPPPPRRSSSTSRSAGASTASAGSSGSTRPTEPNRRPAAVTGRLSVSHNGVSSLGSRGSDPVLPDALRGAGPGRRRPSAARDHRLVVTTDDEDLPVPDPSGPRLADDRPERGGRVVVEDEDGDLDLGEERVAVLAAEVAVQPVLLPP